MVIISINDIIGANNITQIVAAISLGFTAFNIYLLYRTWRYTQDEKLLSIVIKNLDEAILILEKSVNYRNDGHKWHVTANQLSAFHNLAGNIKNYNLKKSYCAKLDQYTMRVYKLVSSVNTYLFYYGVYEFNNADPNFIKHVALRDNLYLDPNALNCIIQFISILHGVRADYLYNKKSLQYIFKPIVVGFNKNYMIKTREELSIIHPPALRNIYEYMVDINETITKSRISKERRGQI